MGPEKPIPNPSHEPQNPSQSRPLGPKSIIKPSHGLACLGFREAFQSPHLAIASDLSPYLGTDFVASHARPVTTATSPGPQKANYCRVCPLLPSPKPQNKTPCNNDSYCRLCPLLPSPKLQTKHPAIRILIAGCVPLLPSPKLQTKHPAIRIRMAGCVPCSQAPNCKQNTLQ